MKHLGLAGAALLLAATAMPAAAQNLVQNGSFENGFSSWTVSHNSGTAPVVIAYNSATDYPTGAFGEAILPNTVTSRSPDAAGNFVAYFSSDTANPDSLTQTVTLTSGTAYNIGFDYYAPQNGINNPFDATLSLVVNGVTISTQQAGSVTGTPGRTWLNFNTSFFNTTAGAQTFSFQFRGLGTTAADFAIDRVYAVAAVPEPATWAMMIGGFGLVGGAMRRRRSTSVSFA